MIEFRKAISFSLFGNALKYVQGAVENAWLASRIYPGWDCIIHVERGHSVIPELVQQGAIIVEHAKEPKLAGTFWRFETFLMDYDVVICRDADSRLGLREKACVDAWLEGGKTLHIMSEGYRVDPTNIPAGMFGLNANRPDLSVALAKPRAVNYGADERFLREVLRDFRYGDSLHHSRTHLNKGSQPFPPKAPKDCKIGRRCDPSKGGMPVFLIGREFEWSTYTVPHVHGLGKILGIATAHHNAASLLLRRGVFPALVLEADAQWMSTPRRCDLPNNADWVWVGLSRFSMSGDGKVSRSVTVEPDARGHIKMDGMLATHGVAYLTEEGARRMLVCADHAITKRVPIDVAIVTVCRERVWDRPGLANPWVFQTGRWRKDTKFSIRSSGR